MANKVGYLVSIKGFIPVDQSDIDGHAKALAAILTAVSPPAEPIVPTNDPMASMFNLMEIETFDVKPVSRRAKGEGEAS